MTCCVGLVSGGEVWIAADSASTNADDDTQEIVWEPKTWEVNGWVLAFAGSWRIGQLLRHELKPPAKLRRDLDRYVQIDLVRDIRSIAHAESDAAINDAELLVGTRGALYLLQLSDYTALRSRSGYAAIGRSDALVGLAATATVKRPRARLLRVMHAVSKHVTSVRPPFTLVHTP